MESANILRMCFRLSGRPAAAPYRLTLHCPPAGAPTKAPVKAAAKHTGRKTPGKTPAKAAAAALKLPVSINEEGFVSWQGELALKCAVKHSLESRIARRSCDSHPGQSSHLAL